MAQLGIQVAEALDHAHELGVVHRDIKPSNLMVDAGGKPWIADFGLARIEANPSLTLSGDLLGTLRYMSPEQAMARRAVVDHRTDIYSLGATLYELVTLRPAFGSTTRQALLRQIAFDEPRAPRKLNRAIPADLETILLKAIAKNPAERYATAQDLADDLRRFLDLKPIRAKRPTVAQRAAKWSRRHKAVVRAGAVLLLVGMIGLAVSAALISREQARTRAALQEATRERDRAEENVHLAKTALEKERRAIEEAKAKRAEAERAAAAANAVVAFLTKDLLGSASPEKALGRDVTVKEVLTEAEKKIDKAFRNQPLVEAAVRHTMGTIYRQLGQYEAAKRHLVRARELHTQVLGPEHPGTLRSINNLAFVLGQQGKLGEARKLHEETLGIRKRILGPEHPDTLCSMHNLAVVLAGQGKLDQARKLYEETLAIQQRVLGPEHPQTLGSMNNLAMLLRAQRHLDQARKLHEETLKLGRRVLGPEHPDTLRLVHDLAVVLGRQGKREEARKAYEETVAIQKRVLGPEHPDTLLSMHNLAKVLSRQAWSLTTCPDEKSRDPARAMELATRATELQATSAMAWQVLGWAHYRLGAWKASIEALEKSMRLQKNRRGDLWQWFFLAMAHWQLGHKDEARQWYDRAVEWMLKRCPRSREARRFRAEAAALLGIKDAPVAQKKEATPGKE